MKLKATQITLAMALAGSVLATTAQAEFNRGEMLANTCVGCHGPMGISHGPATPSIGGLSEVYFTETMNAYRDGSRPSTIMTRIAKGYSDEDIADMAKYFAAQKHEASPANAGSDAALIAKGQKLHDKYCEKCHSDMGTNPADDAGFLKGQTAPYIHYSIEDVMAGHREVDKKMVKKLEELQKKEGDEGMKALIEFYTSK
jgi:sulfide dehydrogenase cytochrome subunit